MENARMYSIVLETDKRNGIMLLGPTILPHELRVGEDISIGVADGKEKDMPQEVRYPIDGIEHQLVLSGSRGLLVPVRYVRARVRSFSNDAVGEVRAFVYLLDTAKPLVSSVKQAEWRGKNGFDLCANKADSQRLWSELEELLKWYKQEKIDTE